MWPCIGEISSIISWMPYRIHLLFSCVEQGKQERAPSSITTILDRDIRDLAQIQDLAVLPRLLQLLAGRTATLYNQSEVSRSSGIPNSTLSRYMTLLEMTFLAQTLPAWSSNLGKRLVKAPKLFMVDTGLACHLLRQRHSNLQWKGNCAVRERPACRPSFHLD
jgi:predicted AAA+ superfamily ATPase